MNRQQTTDNRQQIFESLKMKVKNSFSILNFSLLIVNCTLLIALFSSCDNKQYQPKPRGYFRIDFPEKEYVRLDSMNYYSFEYPNGFASASTGCPFLHIGHSSPEQLR